MEGREVILVWVILAVVSLGVIDCLICRGGYGGM